MSKSREKSGWSAITQKPKREMVQAKADRKSAKVRADLAVTETKIRARLEKVLGKGDLNLMAHGATPRARGRRHVVRTDWRKSIAFGETVMGTFCATCSAFGALGR